MKKKKTSKDEPGTSYGILGKITTHKDTEES